MPTRIIINSKAFCWRNWIPKADSDVEEEEEESSIVVDDYDDSEDEGEASRGLWIDGSDGSDSDTADGGPATIYPGPDHQHSRYRHAHLRDFSRAAIQQYNHDTGNKYEFVELVEASVVTTVKAAFIEVIFKACQSDDTMVATSFRAEARSASKTLTNSYDIETVAPLPLNSEL